MISTSFLLFIIHVLYTEEFTVIESFLMRKMHEATCIVAKLQHNHKIILESLSDRNAYNHAVI